MNRNGGTLTACAAAIAVLTSAPAARAGSWWSSTVGNLFSPCTGGPTALAAPTGQPVLGDNLIVAAPFYTGTSTMGIMVLVPPVPAGHDKVAWEWINSQCYDLSSKGNQFWGLNVTGAAGYFYGYTSPLDASPGKVFSTAFTTSDTWAISAWGTEFTSTQIYLGAPGSTATGWTTLLDDTHYRVESVQHGSVHQQGVFGVARHLEPEHGLRIRAAVLQRRAGRVGLRFRRGRHYLAIQ